MVNVDRYWYRSSPHLLSLLLLPFAWMFSVIIRLRRWFYCNWLKPDYFRAPVIVVGNITVGGTGKTPFVIWLAKWLRSQGYQPGIVSRGAGGAKQKLPHQVMLNDDVMRVGDEAMILTKRTACPVVICVDRCAAVRHLLQHTDCDVVISDGGLQHYRMGRQIEMVIVDGQRRFGNGLLLPAGPLREPVKRLQDVNFVVVNGGDSNDAFTMTLTPIECIALQDDARAPLTAFADQTVHAVAGIGNPDRFFQTLKEANIRVIPHVFPDHHHYQVHELGFDDALPIIMTEKDAIKCRTFADARFWSLRVAANVSEGLEVALQTVNELPDTHKDDDSEGGSQS